MKYLLIAILFLAALSAKAERAYQVIGTATGGSGQDFAQVRKDAQKDLIKNLAAAERDCADAGGTLTLNGSILPKNVAPEWVLDVEAPKGAFFGLPYNPAKPNLPPFSNPINKVEWVPSGSKPGTVVNLTADERENGCAAFGQRQGDKKANCVVTVTCVFPGPVNQ